MRFRETTLAAREVRSLVWHGDSLIDWIDGGKVFHLDGSSQESSVVYSYRFDAAVTSPSGKYSVIYERLGTKGAVLEGGYVLREINRSFYHADVYEYPIVLFALADGREVIAHCPEEYNQLEIDDLQTGERLTRSPSRDSSDFFHSRLAVSPDRSRLLSAGWFWHPFDAVAVFDVQAALAEGRELDAATYAVDSRNQISSAAFLSEDELVVSNCAEFDEGGSGEEEPFSPGSLGIWSLPREEWLSISRPERHVGTLMPMGSNHVVGFYENPSLIDIRSGAVQKIWPIPSGTQTSSIIHHHDPSPPIALDFRNSRFAVATKDEILIVQAVAE